MAILETAMEASVATHRNLDTFARLYRAVCVMQYTTINS